MRPRCDGYYLSGLQRREDWHAGVRMVDEYYCYLQFFDDGRWLWKHHPTTDLDFRHYLRGVTAETFNTGWAGQHPHDANLDLLHRTGRFTVSGDRVELESRSFLIVMHEFRWLLRLVPPDQLLADDGTVYVFMPAARR